MGSRTAKKVDQKSRSFDQILVDQGMLTAADLNTAKLNAINKNVSVLDILLSEGIVTDVLLAKALAEQGHMEFIDLTNITPDPEVLKILPEAAARKFLALPIKFENDAVVVALRTPDSAIHIEKFGAVHKRQFIFKIAGANSLNSVIQKVYSPAAASQDVKSTAADSGLRRIVFKDGPLEIESTINQILKNCIELRASDIHLEPDGPIIRVRARIDGILHEMTKFDIEYHAQLISRIKILGNLDIAEKRNPQDGSFQHQLENKVIDMRLSTLPTVRGEKAVIRILDKSVLQVSLDAVGLSPTLLESLKHVLDAPHGLVLVTGPTGSGKTTTVYSMLNHINSLDKNIITVEDPVEYQMGIINQVQVNAKAGLTFATILRNILRQDPDVVMLGEIRDKETADLAIRAALTGHLVISTIHTNDSVNTVTRLIDMGIEPFMVSSALAGVLSQRLVRTLCTKCKADVTLESGELANISPAFANLTKTNIYKAVGCPACLSFGYKGRQPIFELLVPTSQIRKEINNSKSPDDLMEMMLKSGFQTMRVDGMFRVIEGKTSVDEVLKATV